MPSCCRWRDFKVWLQDMWKLPVPIDWREAREAHSRYCCTPGEYYRAMEVRHSLKRSAPPQPEKQP
jgi:hypothetical protein